MTNQLKPDASETTADTVIFSDAARSLTVEALAEMRNGAIADRQQEDIVLLVDAIEAIDAERSRVAAILSGNFEKTKLIDCNLSGSEFSLALADGPIPYLVEYLAQMLGHRQRQTPSNYCALDVSHREFGPMILSLQRKHGKSPHVVAAEHLAALKHIHDWLSGDTGDGKAVLQYLEAYLSALPGEEQS